jgi:hypothetical protein
MPVFLDRAKAHEESGLYFDPPNERTFRLSESEIAGTLFQGFGVQEMDFGWWDEPAQTMNLLEVKDYSEKLFNEEHYLNECIQKATDCLLLLASIWYNLPYGQKVSHLTPATKLFFMNDRAAASRGLPIKSSDDLLGVPAPSRTRRR